jgi:glucokinase
MLMILAGDVGGTKTALALCEESADGLRVVREATFASQEHASLENVLAAFLKDATAPPLRAGCFGVAGPVLDGTSHITNLSWVLEEGSLAEAIAAPRVKLLNDLEAAAYGMLHLQPGEFSVLHAGSSPARKGNVAVIAPGTGLGESMLYWDGTVHHPVASEGGHADFAPRTDQEIALLHYLRKQFGSHISYERVLSGHGLYNLYSFLRDSGYAPEPSWVTEQLKSGDPSATITRLGLADEVPLCVATLDLFSSILGAEAGNLALRCMALGGVFIGGGIPPKVLAALQKGGCMRAFVDKGRFNELLQSIEVRVALNPRAPLLGAAHYALRL